MEQLRQVALRLRELVRVAYDAAGQSLRRALTARLDDLRQVWRFARGGGWRTLRDFHGLIAAWRSGGTTVSTEGSIAWTLTPTGDVVQRIKPAALDNSALVERHRRAVARHLEPLTQLSALLRTSAAALVLLASGMCLHGGGRLVPIVDDGWAALRSETIALARDLWWIVALGVLTAILRQLLKWWIQQQIQQLFDESSSP